MNQFLVDSKSQLALQAFANASQILNNDKLWKKSAVIGALACHDWPNLCNRYNISFNWPVLIAFFKHKNITFNQPHYNQKIYVDWIKML